MCCHTEPVEVCGEGILKRHAAPLRQAQGDNAQAFSRRKTFTIYHLPFTILLFCLLLSCSGGAQQKRTSSSRLDKSEKLQLVSPKNNAQIKNNEEIKIVYLKPNFQYDSVVAYLENKRVATLVDTSSLLKVNIQRFGRKLLTVKLFKDSIEVAATSVNLTVLPSLAPKTYGYRIVTSYPHSDQAYTQGLQIQNGTLYESTGLHGKSVVRIADLQSGKTLKDKALSKEYFGEGLCVLNGLLYQLTWREQTCFVYDSKTLDLQTTIPYSGEGWGLTSDDKLLIMSNGTNVITFRSPNDFSVRKRLEVYTDKGPVSYLNELELINGELWANVYGADYIVRIDTASGAVNSVVNLQGILPNALKDSNTDVLNGIAYNEKTGQIFVTGKNWKRLFEIQVK